MIIVIVAEIEKRRRHEREERRVRKKEKRKKEKEKKRKRKRERERKRKTEEEEKREKRREKGERGKKRKRKKRKRKREEKRESGLASTFVAPHSLCQILWCVDSFLSHVRWCQSAWHGDCVPMTQAPARCLVQALPASSSRAHRRGSACRAAAAGPSPYSPETGRSGHVERWQGHPRGAHPEAHRGEGRGADRRCAPSPLRSTTKLWKSGRPCRKSSCRIVRRSRTWISLCLRSRRKSWKSGRPRRRSSCRIATSPFLSFRRKLMRWSSSFSLSACQSALLNKSGVCQCLRFRNKLRRPLRQCLKF